MQASKNTIHYICTITMYQKQVYMYVRNCVCTVCYSYVHTSRHVVVTMYSIHVMLTTMLTANQHDTSIITGLCTG